MAAEVGPSRGCGACTLWKPNGAGALRRRGYADAPVLPTTGTPGPQALRSRRGMADGPHPRAGTGAGPGRALLGRADARALGGVPRPGSCRRPDPCRRRGVLPRNCGSAAGTSAPQTVGGRRADPHLRRDRAAATTARRHRLAPRARAAAGRHEPRRALHRPCDDVGRSGWGPGAGRPRRAGRCDGAPRQRSVDLRPLPGDRVTPWSARRRAPARRREPGPGRQ